MNWPALIVLILVIAFLTGNLALPSVGGLLTLLLWIVVLICVVELAQSLRPRP
jgi:hypothetical protein